MPLPLIPALIGGAALATAAFGAKKGYDGYQDTKEVEKLHQRAKDSYEETKRELESHQRASQDIFEIFGKTKQSVLQNNLTRFQELINKIDYKEETFKEASHFTSEQIRTISAEILDIKAAVGGLLASAGSGALAGFGAYGGAGLLATASTGSAISSLSGVAATNATLAWFGGGSLAAGGLGMAGGAYVLGGIVTAPIIAVAASVFAAKAKKAKYDAQAYYDSIRGVVEAMRGEMLGWMHIYNRCKEANNELNTLDPILGDKITIVLAAFGKFGPHVSAWPYAQEHVKNMVSIAETMCNIIKAPILNDQDKITQEIMKHQQKSQEILKEINAKWNP